MCILRYLSPRKKMRRKSKSWDELLEKKTVDEIRWTFVKRHLRRASLLWPGRYAALVQSRVATNRYRCNSCTKIFERRHVELDHVVAVIGTSKGIDYISFVMRLLGEPKCWQVLCLRCHKKKTIKDMGRGNGGDKRQRLS